MVQPLKSIVASAIRISSVVPEKGSEINVLSAETLPERNSVT